MNDDAVVVRRWRRTVWFGLLWDGNSTEGSSDWWFELGGWGGVSLGAFVMAAELLLIKFIAVAVMVFDFVILIDGVKRDNLALMESSVGKTFSDDCTNRKNKRRWWRSFGAAVMGCWWGGHPLNSGRGHPLSLRGGGM